MPSWTENRGQVKQRIRDDKARNELTSNDFWKMTDLGKYEAVFIPFKDVSGEYVYFRRIGSHFLNKTETRRDEKNFVYHTWSKVTFNAPCLTCDILTSALRMRMLPYDIVKSVSTRIDFVGNCIPFPPGDTVSLVKLTKPTHEQIMVFLEDVDNLYPDIIEC